MRYLNTNADNGEITLSLTKQEIQDLILYLGHGRYAKSLDARSYENLGWQEQAKIARQQTTEIAAKMQQLNDLLLEAYK